MMSDLMSDLLSQIAVKLRDLASLNRLIAADNEKQVTEQRAYANALDQLAGNLPLVAADHQGHLLTAASPPHRSHADKGPDPETEAGLRQLFPEIFTPGASATAPPSRPKASLRATTEFAA